MAGLGPLGTVNDAVGEAEQQTDVAEPQDRRDLTSGIIPIEAKNYLKFVSLPPAFPFTILFDSFALQRVSTQRREQVAIQYTNGSPLIDVFGTGPEILTVSVTIPDTAPFYSTQGGGYLGESLEVLRALYDQYFRASAAVGSKDDQATGYVEFWNKNRVVKGYLIKLAFDRQSMVNDVNDLVFDMFVHAPLRDALRSARREVLP